MPPFKQQKYHEKRFETIFASLKNSPSLTVPGFHVSLGVPVSAIPEKGNFDEISKVIAEWIRANISEKIAVEGPWPEDVTFEEREIPNVGFPLKVDVRKQRIPGHAGGLHFMSTFMPPTLPQELERALSDKVPKLTHTPASLRFLLLEQDNPPYTYWQVAAELEKVIAHGGPSVPGLEAINAIWLADTRDRPSRLWFCQIWRGGVGAAFVVDEPSTGTGSGATAS